MDKNKKVILIAFGTLILDQVIKLIVKTNMALSSTITVIPRFFFITHVENEGAAWSILEGKSIFLVLISILFLVFLISCLRKDQRNTKINIISYGLIMGGIIGNMLDRIFYQKVIDFLSFKIFNYYFPVFNIADMAIVIGMILFIVDVILEGNEHGKMEDEYQKIREKSNGKVSSRKTKY